MGWGGIDLVPLLPGETRRQAVERAYADAEFLIVEDGVPRIESGPGPERDHTRVTRVERAWMLEARRMLEELAPGWRLVDENQEPGRRWPWSQDLEHPAEPMWVSIYGDSVTLRLHKDVSIDDAGWAFWWRVIRRFAAYPCLVYDLDYSEIVATSLSVRAARERYQWM